MEIGEINMPKSVVGARVLDDVMHVSELRAFRRCPMRHYYAYVEGLDPKHVSEKLTTGSFIHKLLEIWYGKGSKAAKRENIAISFGKYEQVLTNDDFMNEGEIGSKMANISEVWDAYEKAVKTLDKGLKPKATEHKFTIPLPGTELKLSGTIDLILDKGKKGGLWIMEHKTGAQERLSQTMILDDQLSTYFYATYKDFGKLPRGIILNFIRTKPPRKPTILKNGTVSKAACVTDQATYLAVVKEAKENKNDYMDFISTLPVTLIPQRFSTNRTKTQILSFMGETARCASACHENTGKYRSATWDCTWDCAYFDLCIIDYTGANREGIIEERYNTEGKNDRSHTSKRKNKKTDTKIEKSSKRGRRKT